MRRVVVLVVTIGMALTVTSGTVGASTVQVFTGEIDGAPYEIRVPADWNRTLFVYAHGYRDLADHVGETDDRSAPVAPTGIDASMDEIADALTDQGYALAGSAFSSNGWAVAEGITDTVALTEAFPDITRRGEPRDTILWGTSMGSIVTFAAAERHAALYDGFLSMCAVGAGSSRAWDGGLVLTTAYEVAFGWPARWGTYDDVRDDIDFETEVLYPTLGSLIDPSDFPEWEFIRRVAHIPADGFYDGANWALVDMFFATEARAELDRRAGAPVARTDIYEDFTLSEEDIEFLDALGLDTEAMLAEVNDLKTNPSTPESREFIETYADYTGDISDPVLTLHTITDGLVPVEHESAYRETVEDAGRDRHLVQLYVDDVGHCTFTGRELLASADAIADWVIDRDEPDPEDFEGIERFDPGFEPEPWPFVRKDG